MKAAYMFNWVKHMYDRGMKDGGQRAVRIFFVSLNRNVSISVPRISLILLNMAAFIADISECPQDVKAARE